MKTSKSSLFLMELIIAILFFALASAVCIQLFVKSHLLSQSTIDKNNALLWCQNIAELYLGSIEQYSSEEDQTYNLYLQSLLGNDERLSDNSVLSSEDGFTIYFDKDWQSCAPETCQYKVVFLNNGYDADTDLNRVYIQASDSQDAVLYDLNIDKYLAEGGIRHE